MKKKIACALLALTLAVSMLSVTALAADAKFTDVPDGAWYGDSMEYVVSHNLFSGTSDTEFSPDAGLSRAMLVTVLGRIEGVTYSGIWYEAFTDVDYQAWYGTYVVWASSHAIVGGYGNGLFGPEDLVTREQAAAIIANYLQSLDKNVPDSASPAQEFKDKGEVSSWAADAVEMMRVKGIMSGDNLGNFNPKKTMSRAEAATLMANLNELMGGKTAPVTVAVTGIGFSQEKYTVAVGEEVTVAVKISPDNASNPTFTLHNENPEIADLSTDGTVYGIKTGTATLTATASNGMTATCSIVVR